MVMLPGPGRGRACEPRVRGPHPQVSRQKGHLEHNSVTSRSSSRPQASFSPPRRAQTFAAIAWTWRSFRGARARAHSKTRGRTLDGAACQFTRSAGTTCCRWRGA